MAEKSLTTIEHEIEEEIQVSTVPTQVWMEKSQTVLEENEVEEDIQVPTPQEPSLTCLEMDVKKDQIVDETIPCKSVPPIEMSGIRPEDKEREESVFFKNVKDRSEKQLPTLSEPLALARLMVQLIKQFKTDIKEKKAGFTKMIAEERKLLQQKQQLVKEAKQKKEDFKCLNLEMETHTRNIEGWLERQRLLEPDYKETLDWACGNGHKKGAYSMDVQIQAYLVRVKREPFDCESIMGVNDAIVAALDYARCEWKTDPLVSSENGYYRVISLGILILAVNGYNVNDYVPLMGEDHFRIAKQLNPKLQRRKMDSCIIQ